MSEKRAQKTIRTKYIRELERFINRVVNFLNTQNEPSKEEFEEFAKEKYKKVQECERVYLSKGYSQEMEKFAQKIPSAAQSDKEMEEIKNDLLYEANRLRKT
ncbi:MAG: hypothetical protein GXO31_04930, partial [Epsilonproteobacteria bacterium]|nr:hypothetical protein [Campylobacterota bacterium]